MSQETKAILSTGLGLAGLILPVLLLMKGDIEKVSQDLLRVSQDLLKVSDELADVRERLARVEERLDSISNRLDRASQQASTSQRIFPWGRADLDGVNLSGRDLSDVDLSDVDLAGADLTGAILNGADLDGCHGCGPDAKATGAACKLSAAILSRGYPAPRYSWVCGRSQGERKPRMGDSQRLAAWRT